MELDVRERLQRTFDNVLRRQAARLLIDQYERYGTIEPVFVFRSYEPEPWVITTLAQRKIPETKFIPAAKALCVEFIAHHQSGAWPQSPWRRWQATNDSIWLEVIPQAVLEGKHHSNSLRDLMHEPDV